MLARRSSSPLSSCALSASSARPFLRSVNIRVESNSNIPELKKPDYHEALETRRPDSGAEAGRRIKITGSPGFTPI